MKILFVSIPNHHFFQWTNQLKESGYEVYWFDISDGAGFVEKINWVKQFSGWKLKWNYPFRYSIKNYFPRFYSLLQKITINKTETVFETILKEVQPDIVHCFEMKLAGLPILPVMQQNKIPFVYSSWGSDMFYFAQHGIKKHQGTTFLKRVDYLITDCSRDLDIAQQLGFENQFLGIFPGNGGIAIEKEFIQSAANRKTICIKGYEDGVGKAINVLKAIELLSIDESIDFLIFSTDEEVVLYLQQSEYFNQKNVEIIPRISFLQNNLLLQKMGSCMLYIGNSTSDGMPNTLLEAMGMGVFPIQSNPGKASSEVILEDINGFLIENPEDLKAISELIRKAIDSEDLRVQAQEYNVNFIQENYDREKLQAQIVNLYQNLKVK